MANTDENISNIIEITLDDSLSPLSERNDDTSSNDPPSNEMDLLYQGETSLPNDEDIQSLVEIISNGGTYSKPSICQNSVKISRIFADPVVIDLTDDDSSADKFKPLESSQSDFQRALMKSTISPDVEVGDNVCSTKDTPQLKSISDQNIEGSSPSLCRSNCVGNLLKSPHLLDCIDKYKSFLLSPSSSVKDANTTKDTSDLPIELPESPGSRQDLSCSVVSDSINNNLPKAISHDLMSKLILLSDDAISKDSSKLQSEPAQDNKVKSIKDDIIPLSTPSLCCANNILSSLCPLDEELDYEWEEDQGDKKIPQDISFPDGESDDKSSMNQERECLSSRNKSPCLELSDDETQRSVSTPTPNAELALLEEGQDVENESLNSSIPSPRTNLSNADGTNPQNSSLEGSEINLSKGHFLSQERPIETFKSSKCPDIKAAVDVGCDKSLQGAVLSFNDQVSDQASAVTSSCSDSLLSSEVYADASSAHTTISSKSIETVTQELDTNQLNCSRLSEDDYLAPQEELSSTEPSPNQKYPTLRSVIVSLPQEASTSGKMSEGTPSLPTKSHIVERYQEPWISTDAAENADNFDPGWEALRKLKTDEERYVALRKRWKSLTVPNPQVNLSLQNFRKRRLALNATSTSNQTSFLVPPSGPLKRKRSMTSEDGDPQNPPKRLRTISCTQFFTDRIEQLQSQMRQDVKLLQTERQQALQNIRGHTLLLIAQLNSSNLPYYVKQVELQKIYNNEAQQIAMLTNDFHNRVQYSTALKEEKVALLKKAKQEVYTFNKFYHQLQNADAVDHLNITEDEARLFEETEHMYELFDQFYRG